MVVDTRILSKSETFETEVPKGVSLDWKSEELRDVFGDEVTKETIKELSAHDKFNKQAFEATAGWNGNGAAHTATAKNNEQKNKAALAAKKFGHRAIANITIDQSNDSFNINPYLQGIRLDDTHNVQIAPDGKLMVRGEGPDTSLREARLDEKAQLETESQACSVGITQDEIDMNAYFRGETTEIPSVLKERAEQSGIENPTMDDLKELVKTRYADSPHISERILSPYKIDPHFNENLLPSNAWKTMPAAAGGITGSNISTSFMNVVTVGPEQISLMPEPPAVTPAPIPS